MDNMENRGDGAAFPHRPSSRLPLHNSYGDSSYHGKLGGKPLAEEHEDEEEEEDEYDEEEEEEEEEGDDEDSEEEGCDGFELLRRQRSSSFPCLPEVPNMGLNTISGSATALPGANTTRMLTKAGEQEKHYRDDWNEAATLALLQVWGAKFLQLGRKRLKVEDWTQVSQQVTLLVKAFKTDIQCRNRIDTLKKKYKQEKQKQAGIGGPNSKWVYYKHMDVLLSPVPQRIGLPCAVDAGQIVRFKPCSWTQDKQDSVFPFKTSSKGSPKVSQSSLNMSVEDKDNSQRNQTSKKRKSKDAPFRSLAKAIKRFGEIYEKMENAKQQQILDLERTRMEFTRELELQKIQLLIKTQMELAKLKQGGFDMDASVSNMSS